MIAGLILGPALLIGSFAWSGYLALGTIFDEDRSATVAQELLDNEQVKAQVATNIAGSISSALPDGMPVTEEQVDAAAFAVLNDGRITGLVINSLRETHRSFLGLNDVPQTVDLNPVAEVAREQIASISPEAAAAIPADTDWSIDLPTENIPNSSPVKTFLETSVPFLAGISLVMVLMAFLTTSDRPSVLRKAAFWAISTTAVYLIVGYGVPALLRVAIGDQAEIFAALITALLRTTIVPSVVLAVAGAALLLASWLWPDERARPEPTVVRRPAPAPSPPTTPVPTTHIEPVRPQASAPPQQPVTPPSTPVVPATPPSNPVVPADAAPPTDPFAPPVDIPLTSGPDSGMVPPIVTGSDTTFAPPTEPPPFRPTLPTRAAPNERVTLPPWTGDPEPPPDPTPSGGVPKARPPTWVDGHGWVLDPDDERPVPANARYVDGVGYVVPGPPPRP
ncbi:MAG: hypothetical protein CL433_10685 [Acidimicrobiaceae bacterium]|nr:hypothetical protein [Acidimicrobiaceae bacterium]